MLVRFALGKQTVIFDPSVPWHRPGGMAAGDELINLFFSRSDKTRRPSGIAFPRSGSLPGEIALEFFARSTLREFSRSLIHARACRS